MGRNLFIAYDLYIPGQRYQAVENQILRLGTAVKLLNTTWFVKTAISIEQVRANVSSIMDLNDRLLVVDASNAIGWNVDQTAWARLLEQWKA